MGLRPPNLRRARTSATSTTQPTTRAVRPIPERTAPIRTVDRFLRVDPPAAAPATAESAVGDAVSKAYQVFDKYLKEGQEFAAGQSAWYKSPTANALPALPSGGIPSGDVMSALMWLLEQMRNVPTGAIPSMPGIPAMPAMPAMPAPPPPPAAATPATPVKWPRPRWPEVPPNALTSTAKHGRWIEERFEDDDNGVPPNMVPGSVGNPDI